MGIALSNEVKRLVDRPNFAHLATIMSDGSPQSAPVWTGRENDLLLVCTESGSLKGKNTLRDPRVSVSMVDFVDPYSEIQIRGRVVERRPDPELKYYDKMSLKYVGKPWPYRDEESPIVLIMKSPRRCTRSSLSSMSRATRLKTRNDPIFCHLWKSPRCTLGLQDSLLSSAEYFLQFLQFDTPANTL